MDELKSKVNKIIVKPFSPNLGSIITGVDLSKNIYKSIIKTNRLMIIDEDVPGGGSSFILQELLNSQDIYKHLDSKPCLVTAKEHRPPYGSDGDYISKPSFEDIFEEVYTVMNEANPSKYKKLI